MSKLIIEKQPEATAPAAPSADFGVKLSNKKGVKIDLIRIVNAMYENKMFTDNDGQPLTKIKVMKAFGSMLGVDLSNYDKDLSQAFEKNDPTPNVMIFNKLADITKKIVLDKN